MPSVVFLLGVFAADVDIVSPSSSPAFMASGSASRAPAATPSATSVISEAGEFIPRPSFTPFVAAFLICLPPSTPAAVAAASSSGVGTRLAVIFP